ncbi:hypothetical protein V1358_00010 [Pseudoalteromonas sp. YIC-656]|uniref:hypothetical protein n=1 Tax=Pseudoalteromonas pernae TaxID=3118054 RepID=UPI003241C052
MIKTLYEAWLNPLDFIEKYCASGFAKTVAWVWCNFGFISNMLLQCATIAIYGGKGRPYITENQNRKCWLPEKSWQVSPLPLTFALSMVGG